MKVQNTYLKYFFTNSGFRPTKFSARALISRAFGRALEMSRVAGASHPGMAIALLLGDLDAGAATTLEAEAKAATQKVTNFIVFTKQL